VNAQSRSLAEPLKLGYRTADSGLSATPPRALFRQGKTLDGRADHSD
jgi:hypothetical protein